jgi:hypothetical protein
VKDGFRRVGDGIRAISGRALFKQTFSC